MKEMRARGEWARFWPIPFIGLLGVTGPAAFAYSSGVFMEAITGEFGWSRAQFSSAMTIQMLLGLVLGPLAGRVLDRVGPRRMLLVGIFPFTLALSSLGLANGAAWQWWLLAALYSPLAMGLISANWIGGATACFDKSRGLAISIVLAGIGLATAAWPAIAAWLLTTIGWRLAFPAMAWGWALLVFPLVFFLFKPPSAPVEQAVVPQPPVLRPVLRSPTFLLLLAGGSLFSSVQLALIVHFVPVARQFGLDLTAAARLAVLIGLFSIVGRIATGFMLDRLPTRPLAIAVFSLPLAVLVLLSTASGSLVPLMAAAALLGFAAGAEMDVVTYLATRRFDPRIFGTIYSIFMAAIAISASLGPLLAGRMYDVSGSYQGYFIVAAGFVVAATVLVGLVPAAPRTTPQPV